MSTFLWFVCIDFMKFLYSHFHLPSYIYRNFREMRWCMFRAFSYFFSYFVQSSIQEVRASPTSILLVFPTLNFLAKSTNLCDFVKKFSKLLETASVLIFIETELVGNTDRCTCSYYMLDRERPEKNPCRNLRRQCFIRVGLIWRNLSK